MMPRKITKQEALELYGLDLDNVVKRDDFVHFSKRDDIIDDYPYRGDRDENTGDKLSSALKALTNALIKSLPGLDETAAMQFILHTPHGRAMFNHFSPHGRTNHFSKHEKESPMTRMQEMAEMHKFVKQGGMIAIAKHVIEKGSTTVSEFEYTALLKSHCTANSVSFEKALSDPVLGKAYKIIRDANHVAALGYHKRSEYDAQEDDGDPRLSRTPRLMSIEPVVTSGEDALAINDPTEALAALNALAEKQHRTFEEISLDPANARLAAVAFRRPNASSTSGSELQR